MRSAIQTFEKNNKVKPKKIIVYRDGVSGSQQGTIMVTEVKTLTDICKEDDIKLAYLIANKRVSARYFVNNGGRLSGALPGMYIDKKIVTSTGNVQDFFLVSQISRQGAASPTHYHILWMDEGAFTKQDLIKLTYKLCYLYFHINAGIKVPAPIQYAERLGTMLGDKVNS